MGFWNARRTDWETSAAGSSRGDFVYYDWTGDGVWDHVAVVVGTNSAGQKVIDAHTTDHYRVFWKLGYSRRTTSTRVRRSGSSLTAVGGSVRPLSRSPGTQRRGPRGQLGACRRRRICTSRPASRHARTRRPSAAALYWFIISSV